MAKTRTLRPCRTRSTTWRRNAVYTGEWLRLKFRRVKGSLGMATPQCRGPAVSAYLNDWHRHTASQRQARVSRSGRFLVGIAVGMEAWCGCRSVVWSNTCSGASAIVPDVACKTGRIVGRKEAAEFPEIASESVRDQQGLKF